VTRLMRKFARSNCELWETRNAVDMGVALEMKACRSDGADRAGTTCAGTVAGCRSRHDAGTRGPYRTTARCGFQSDGTGCKRFRFAPTVTGTVQVALARNPEIEAAGQQIEKARAGVSAARAEFIPQVGAFFQYIHENGAPFVSPNTGAVGLSLKWTVFEFGKRRGQVLERRAEVAQAEESLAQVRRRVQVDVERRFESCTVPRPLSIRRGSYWHRPRRRGVLPRIAWKRARRISRAA